MKIKFLTIVALFALMATFTPQKTFAGVDAKCDINVTHQEVLEQPTPTHMTYLCYFVIPTPGGLIYEQIPMSGIVNLKQAQNECFRVIVPRFLDRAVNQYCR